MTIKGKESHTDSEGKKKTMGVIIFGTGVKPEFFVVIWP